MIINRVWAMPSKWTFTIKPIKEIEKEVFVINHAELMSKQEKERLEIIKDFLYRLNNIDSDGDLRILEQGDKNDNQYI